MPASPSFPSDTRNHKWRKRKREPQINRRQKHEDEDEDEDDEDVEDEHEHQREEDSEGLNHTQLGVVRDPKETEVLSDSGVRCCDFPLVVRHSVNRPHPSVLAIAALERANRLGESKAQLQGGSLFLENISYGQLQALSSVPADSPSLDQDKSDGSNSSYVLTPPSIMEGRGVVKRFGSRVHIVPMHSDWFSPASVNRLERQVVPHFFSGKSRDHTLEYVECRNYIVAKYMENPEKQLTLSDFLGSELGVDTEDLTRIFRFLNHWGIINYSAAAPSSEPQNDILYLREDPNGEIQVPSDALKSIDSLIKFDKPKCKFKAADVYSSLSFCDVDVSDLDDRICERLSENHCIYCSCSLPTVYYQSQKEVDTLLCSDCFHEGRFMIGHSSIDFTRVDSSKECSDLDVENWTDQETLSLLEAMELYNDNWNEIAEHVGTKSKAQCILHFLRLPVEDGLLENIEVPGTSRSLDLSNRNVNGKLNSISNGEVEGSCQPEVDSESWFPFANSGNPVMALVAFLASAIGPRIAAACAHASLAVLSEDDHGLSASGSLSQMEGSGHGNRINVEIIHGTFGGSQGNMENSNHQKEEISAAHGSRGQNEVEATPLATVKVKAAAEAGLAAAATKAKLFADHEEREIQRLSANIVNHQLKRLELKLKQFAEVETFLMKECEQVERQRQRVFAERARLMSTRLGPAGVTSSLCLPGVGSSMVNNHPGNNRQQTMSPSHSQPSSIPGYNNNQPVHTHMPFMARRPMFGFGPRLPQAATESASSSPSNVMFNASRNTQPTLNHPLLRPVPGSSGLG